MSTEQCITCERIAWSLSSLDVGTGDLAWERKESCEKIHVAGEWDLESEIWKLEALASFLVCEPTVSTI